MTSITLPESVITHDSNSFHQTYGDSSVGGHNDKSYDGIEVQHDGKPFYWTSSDGDNEYEGATEKQNEVSSISDFVPLIMTDEYVIDEIEYVRQLMGYEVGFDGYTSIREPILEVDEEGEQFVIPSFPQKSYKLQQGQRKPNQRPPQCPAKALNARTTNRQPLTGDSRTVTRQVLAHIGPSNIGNGHPNPQQRSSAGTPLVQEVIHANRRPSSGGSPTHVGQPNKTSSYPQQHASKGAPIVQQAIPTNRQSHAAGSPTISRQVLPYVGQPNIRPDRTQYSGKTGAPMAQQVHSQEVTRTHRQPPPGSSPTTTRRVLSHVGQPNMNSGHPQQHTSMGAPILKQGHSQRTSIPKQVLPPKPPPSPSQQSRSGVSSPISNLLAPRLFSTKTPTKHQVHGPPHVDIEIPAEIRRRLSDSQKPSYTDVTCSSCGRLINESGKCICRMLEI